MIRFAVVLATILAVAGLTLAHQSALALTLGIAVGLFLLLRGMAAGGSLGNARQFEKKPADVNARIGICLAAAGIASASLGHDPPFPLPFRVFYIVCLVLASLGAVFLAGKGRKE
jgi:peptidoglycan/LPS O-acetylase OafA/YrhL